jgi:hypothetical protein
MFGQMGEAPSAGDDAGWREIHCYAYVERPFDELWPLLATQPNNVLGDGRAVPRGRGTSELHVHLGGVEVARNVAMQFGELVWDDDRAGLSVHCRAARHPGMFPLLEASFELASLPSGRRHLTQVGLVGRYRPPLGVLGGIADRLGGSGIAVESIRRFVEDLARRLETVFTAERSKSAKDESTTEITREPGGPELKKILLMVERLATRPGGAVGAVRRLAATPGVVWVDIDPDSTLAEVHYDPARCHIRDLLDDLAEDDEIPGLTEAG